MVAVALTTRQRLHRLGMLAVLLATPSPGIGQEPTPALIRAVALNAVGAADLTLPWRYHPGDDPRWAASAFDDRGWELVVPTMAPGHLPRDGWQGAGWFRRRVGVEPALSGKPLVLRLETPGATEIYLDGAPLLEFVARRGRRAGAFREVTLTSRHAHVLAVRHTISLQGWAPRTGNLGFLLSVESPDAVALQVSKERREATIVAAFTALSVFLALFHLALFLSYPRARENLFYALTLAASVAIFISDQVLPRFMGELPAIRLEIVSILMTTFFGLLTFYALRTRRLPRAWIVFAAVAIALTLTLFLPKVRFVWIWPVYFGLMVLEVIRVEATCPKVEREGARVLLGGFTILGLVLVIVILFNFGLLPVELISPFIGGTLYMFGMLAFEIAMSLFLAQSFARTNLHLARKTSEIESARALQLSMLPRSLPTVPGLETAAVMVTASEVGGDYYDFRVDSDGSLVVAFGDATGHGVAAGAMVTAVKALFSTLGGGQSLTAVLAECDRVLREMQVKPLHMCLSLARVAPRSVTICSAAMPPVLIHRAATGQIEELGTGGRPIGSRLSGMWTEHSVPLAPGDTLLFASDGFAEQLDPAGHPLGYEALAESLGTGAALSARELLERLLSRVAAWRGNREQGDDITFVAIHVR